MYVLSAELSDRGHEVTLYNRGKTPAQQLPGESNQAFEARKQNTKYLKGDRTNAESLKELIDPSLYSYVYDMNGREATDTAPLADIFASPKSQLKSFIYMSCKSKSFSLLRSVRQDTSLIFFLLVESCCIQS